MGGLQVPFQSTGLLPQGRLGRLTHRPFVYLLPPITPNHRRLYPPDIIYLCLLYFLHRFFPLLLATSDHPGHLGPTPLQLSLLLRPPCTIAMPHSSLTGMSSAPPLFRHYRVAHLILGIVITIVTVINPSSYPPQPNTLYPFSSAPKLPYQYQRNHTTTSTQ